MNFQTLTSTLLLSFLIACAPVNFSRMDSDKREDSFFTQYLKGELNRDFMVTWIFAETDDFRGKIYDIKLEIKDKETMSESEIDRTLALEYDLNLAIHVFNDQNILTRTQQVLGTMISRPDEGPRVTESLSADQIRREGAPVEAISNNNWGVANSIMKNGFKIEEIDFFEFHQSIGK